MQLRDDTEDDTASELLETVSLNNECKKYAEEAREQYNARKRAAYRKKKNEDIISLQEENRPVLAKSGEFINVRLLDALSLICRHIVCT